MRPFTEALLRANTESLAQKGWKPNEQRRCFRKADAMLDYIARIKPSEYRQVGWRTQLNGQRAEGLRYCLEKDMPSKKMRGRCLEVLSELLSIGEDILERSAWLFKKYPALFRAKYASSPQAFSKDVHGFFVRGHLVPESSFPSFKAGENPAVSRDNAFLNRCVEMYNDPIFESSEYQEYSKQGKKKGPYHLWRFKCKAGRRFFNENMALQYVISQLALENDISLKLDKALASQLLRKKIK